MRSSSVWLLALLACTILSYHGHVADEEEEDEKLEEEMSAWSEDLQGWPMPILEKATSEVKSTINLILKRDSESGCTCRESPGQWAICFGASCEQFPKHLNFSSSPLLRVKTTAIREIFQGDLSNLKNINQLEIEGNPTLEKIEPGCFEPMTKLANLSISFNAQLKVLEVGTFIGLDSLLELRLTKNGFQHVLDAVRALSPLALPRLLRLDLSENQFRSINKDELKPLHNSTLREISFILCQLENVHPSSFSALPNLRVLRLGENSLEPSILSALVSSLVHLPLQRLDLYRSGFRRRPPRYLLEAIARTNVTELILAHNQFESFSVGSFPPMPRIRFLDLRGVVTLNIEAEAFADLPQLRVLLLGHNKLSKIEYGAIPHGLLTLDLSSNSADRLFPSYFYLGEEIFVNNTNLTSLNLSYNRLVRLSKGMFVGLNSLEFLSLRNCTLFRLGTKCFSPLKNLKFLDLQNNRFPSSELTAESMGGMPNLKVLQIGGCGLENILGSPFSALTSLEYLDIRANGIVTLDSSLLSPLTNLIGIDLSDNILSPWHSKRLFGSNPRLRIMFLATNKLSSLTSEMLDDFARLSRIDLSGNPFVCDCYLYAAKNDFVERVKINANNSFSENSTVKNLFSRLRSSSAYCFSPDIWRDVGLSDFLDKTIATITCTTLPEQIPSHIDLNRGIPHAFYAITLILLIIIGIFFGVIYRYRWYLRYWIFFTRVRQRRHGTIENGTESSTSVQSLGSVSQKKYRYDAFISYSNEDHCFIVKLVSMLEDHYPYLRLCVYERDFEIGTVITEAIVESVEMSRRTVLIISDAFVRSQWCMWELRMAQHRIFYEDDFGKSDIALVLIRLGPLSEKNLTPMLRYLIDTRIYLQWDPDPHKEQLFWHRLRAALAPPKLQNCLDIKILKNCASELHEDPSTSNVNAKDVSNCY